MVRKTTVEGFVDEVTSTYIKGWAWDGSRPYSRLTIELYQGSYQLVATALANVMREDVLASGKGDGYCGFELEIPGGIASGQPTEFFVKAQGEKSCLVDGALKWSGLPGYRGMFEPIEDHWLRGTVRKQDDDVPTKVRVSIDGRFDFYATSYKVDERSCAQAFGIILPRYLLDGRVHSFRLEEISSKLCLLVVKAFTPKFEQINIQGASLGNVTKTVESLGTPSKRRWGKRSPNPHSRESVDLSANKLTLLANEQYKKSEILLRDDVAASIEALYWAVDLQPENKVFRERMAAVMLDSGRCDEALYHYGVLLDSESSPKHDLLQSYIGLLERHEKSVQLQAFLKQGIKRWPEFELFLTVQLVDAVMRAGDMNTACNLVRAILQKYIGQIQNADAARHLGALALKVGFAEDAERQYRRALENAPDAPELYVGLCNALASAGKSAEAISTIQRGLNVLDINGCGILHDWLKSYKKKNVPKKPKLIAYYLPQFHPIAENNEWWGEGFTEWSNVARATPMYGGHLQPRRPTSLGYYDLRLPETVNAQFALAKQYGIDAFCYYHYWFNGRRLLEKPLDDLLKGKTGPFPFCICWVNEEWRRNWDGLSGEVLMPLDHTPEMDMKFIVDNIHILQHRDYVRVDDKPMLLVYSANKLSDPVQVAKTWREHAVANGLPGLYLCAVQSFGFDDPLAIGFDAAVEFPPHCPWDKYPGKNYLREISILPNLEPGFEGTVYDYHHFADCAIERPDEVYPLLRSCMLAWDNTARRGKAASVYGHFAVQKYQQWLSRNIGRALNEPRDAIVFINAWNEWAEGASLEPDEYFGYALLEATRKARLEGQYLQHNTWWVDGVPRLPAVPLKKAQRLLLFGHDAFRAGAQINLLYMARHLKRDLKMDLIIFLLKGGELVSEYEKVATTFVLEDIGGMNALEGMLYHYKCMGVTKAICNSVATGEVTACLKRHGFAVCSLVHELPSIIESYGMGKAASILTACADSVVFASTIVRDHFIDRFNCPSEKILVARQGIRPNPYVSCREDTRKTVRAELGLSDDTAIVMGCGYGDLRKGIDLLVQIAATVRRLHSGKPVLFLWVGAIDEQMRVYIENDVIGLGLGDSFRLTGIVEDTARYYIAADIFALTSREDPFPSVVMEAMDAGLPVVAFDGGGGYVDIVGDETGALVPYLDTLAFAEAVCALLLDESKLTSLRLSNQTFSRREFSYVSYLKKILALLDNIPPSLVAKNILLHADIKQGKRISVVIPNFNYANYLELRLRTVLDQSLQPDEIIILDDASTDLSMEIIETLIADCPVPCKIIRNEENSGNVFHQWAKGIAAATGDLIWVAEADDYCEPIFLERLVPEFVDPEVVLAYSESCMVDERGRSSGACYVDYYRQFHGSLFNSSFVMPGEDILNQCLFINNTIPNASAVVFRRSAAESLMNDISEYAFSGDWWFWIGIASRGKVAYESKALNYHRRHDASVMGKVLKDGEQLLSEFIAFYSRVLTYKSDIIKKKTAIRMLERLQQLYQEYEELGGCVGTIEDSTVLGAKYRDMSKQIESLTQV